MICKNWYEDVHRYLRNKWLIDLRKDLGDLAGRNTRDYLAPQERTDPEEQAPHPLLESQGFCAERHFTVLNDENLIEKKIRRII